MTTLISWISFDHRKFAAAYVASDSRITWDVAGKKRWDAGRKVFPSKRFPDVFGYAGDVLFPALALSQIVEAIDAGAMFAPDATPWQRHETIFSALQDSFQRRHQAVDSDFSILHLARSDQDGGPSVHAWCIEYNVGSQKWLDRILHVPSSTGVIARLGSGADAARDYDWRWNRDEPLSRAIFSSFYDAIASGEDALSGGAPQLAGFYPQKAARPFVVQFDNEIFLNGLPLKQLPDGAQLEARDRLFHRIDPSTGKLVVGAQVHARPKHSEP
ncbi:hypothetical protein G6K91_00015 [Agrobacterium rhizogenes]|nr:hypothetical protein [Rhizobium rhizogenes]NTG51902.1 hypothetical protein [Rhizobium rhizogenes]NTG97607.1 hypothetical protein [Rhizobium rhizogenes]NTI53322.1 hypothetical protein [Rhizobium rhizogenes]